MSAPIGTNPFLNQQAPAQSATADPSLTPFGNPEDEDTFRFDLSNAQSSAPIRPGTYLVYCIDLAKGTSQANNPKWDFKLEIIRKANGEPDDQATRTLNKSCALTETALGILAETLEGLGLGGSGKMADFKRQDALGRLCYVEVTKGEYNNRPTANVGRVFPFDPPGARWDKITQRPITS